MTLVLLILAAVWAAVLIPPALRSRAESRPADSITNFHRQLSVLRRTGPRGRSAEPPGYSRRAAAQAATAVVAAPRLRPVSPLTQPVHPAATAARLAATRRAATRRRRRDVLLALLIAAGLTLVLGAVPGLRGLWLVHVAVDFLLIGYVLLLVRQRNISAERQLKVRMLPTGRRRDAFLGEEAWLDVDAGWISPEALLRRSAT